MKQKRTEHRHFIDKIIVRFLEEKDKGSFGSQDKIFFFKELGYMIRGGVSLVEAVRMLADNSENFAIKTIARDVAQYLHRGQTLSYSINRFPDYFNEGDYHIIKSGEKTGNLAQVLNSLAEEYAYLNSIRKKYIGALIYPAILIIVAMIAIISLFGFVLPGIFEIANSFPNVEIPIMTKILKNISDFITGYWKILGILIVLVGTFLGIYFSTRTGKRTFFRLLLKTPLVGNMTKYYYLIKRCRYMKLMLESGLNYMETFQLLRDILGLPAYQKTIEKILAKLQKGETIYDGLKDERHIIPANVSLLIKVGEETANLDKSLDNVLQIYQEELNHMIDSLSKVIEPIMLVFIGSIVIVVAMGVFGLILQIMENVGI